jgi:subtilisin family serine protease
MGATRLWKKGLSGEGVLLAALDTGAQPAHEQFRENFRGGEASWFDPVGGGEEPLDYVDHGTRVLGCAVAGNKADRVLGAAPKAEWVAGVVLPRGWFHHVALTAVADWILREAQPDVIVNSWFTGNPDCDPFHDGVLGAWRVAEIFVVFGAGNRGGKPTSGGTPANTAALPPDGGPAFSVGAVDRDLVVGRRSSRGPSQCGGLFPQVCAPGLGILVPSAKGEEAYLVSWGTSLAAGYVAGGAALLLEAYPEARVVDLEAALRETARDLGPEGPDNDCGHGMVDLPAALEWLEANYGSEEEAGRP